MSLLAQQGMFLQPSSAVRSRHRDGRRLDFIRVGFVILGGRKKELWVTERESWPWNPPRQGGHVLLALGVTDGSADGFLR